MFQRFLFNTRLCHGESYKESNSPECNSAILIKRVDHIHKDVEQNTKDIVPFKEQVAMGRGGLKVIFYIGGIINYNRSIENWKIYLMEYALVLLISFMLCW